LDCAGNKLTALDVSKNVALTTLYCYSNQLSTIYINPAHVITANWKKDATAQYIRLTLCEARILAGLSNAPTSFNPVPLPAVCSGNAIIYTVIPVPGADAYIWAIDGNIVAGATTLTKTWAPTEAGNRIVSVAAVSTCGTSTFLHTTVSVAPPPAKPGSITGPATICIGNDYKFTITPTANTLYKWYIDNVEYDPTYNSSYASFNFAMKGNKVISVKSVSSNGACWSAASSRTAVVNGVPFFSTIVGGDVVCPNTTDNSYYVTPEGTGIVYTWYVQNNENLSMRFSLAKSSNSKLTVPANVAGGTPFTIICKGEDACGKSVTISKPVKVSSDIPPAPNVTCSGINCADLVITNNGNHKIDWLVDGVVKQSGGTTYVRSTASQVQCRYTSATGCLKSTYYTPTCAYSARIAEAEEILLSSDKPFVIYPNPAKEVFVIQTKGQAGTASIYDITGQLVQEVDLYENQNTYNVEISTAGVYTIEIKTATDKKAYKIIVE
jgi:hypothetical protein